jgi:hypothetical protein
MNMDNFIRQLTNNKSSESVQLKIISGIMYF